MFQDFRDYITDLAKRLFTSRLFLLAVIFFGMFSILLVRLFRLQIIEGEKYQEDYVSMAEKVIRTSGTRGNIYDRNGNILAGNRLAYNISIQDVGAYRGDAEFNSMLFRLIKILERHGTTASCSLELGFDNLGNVIYTCESEEARKRFLRDYYGLKNVSELDDDAGKYPSGITAEQLYERLFNEYRLDRIVDRNGNPVNLDRKTALQILDIRYTMRFTEFQKYESTTIARNVDDRTVADILEHEAEIAGVNVDESTSRVYYEAVYFAPIIGYTGKITAERLEELQKSDPDYELNDIVGRTGIESSMELALKGKKGSQTAYVDNKGRILDITDSHEAAAGDDIYLTLDLNLQKGIYYILERQLAGVLLGTIVNQEADTIEYIDSSKIKIPVKDAYFQLVNNNVISLERLNRADAGPVEHSIAAKYREERVRVDNAITEQLTGGNPLPMNQLPEDMQAYMNYIYSFLSKDNVGIIRKSAIDTSSVEYNAWKDGTISLRDYLYYGISSSWIDTTKLDIAEKYSDAEDVFNALAAYVSRSLSSDQEFTKRIYRYLINNNVVSGRELLLALYAQGGLPEDPGTVALLESGDENTAFAVLMEKIRSIEITPAQLALDPCTASCTVTNVRTGEVVALVTYPSYDNGKIDDPAYFAQLNADLSLP